MYTPAGLRSTFIIYIYIVLGLGKNLHNLGRGGHRRCQKVIYPKGSCFFRYHFEAESETGTSAMAEFVQGVCTGKLHAT